MSRSYKKVPIFGNAKTQSDKWYKTQEHQRARAKQREALAVGAEDKLHKLETGNPWGAPKDGKHYWAKAKTKDMRK